MVTRRYLEAFWKYVRPLLLAGFVEIGLFYLIVLAGQSGLLDLRTIVSVTVTEVGIGVFLYYFLGQGRRGREEEMVNLMDAAEKLSHLKVYTFSVLKASFYYVENTVTKEYYKAPRNIEDMADLGVITVIVCKNEQDMKATLAKNNSHKNEQEPSIVQLMATKRARTRKRKQTGSVKPSVKTSP